MAKKSVMELIGNWAFVIGVVIAIIAGLVQPTLGTVILWVLVILGIIIGLLNISVKEATPFLMAAVVLVIVTSLSKGVLGGVLGGVLDAIMVLVVPATIIVALREVFGIAKT